MSDMTEGTKPEDAVLTEAGDKLLWENGDVAITEDPASEVADNNNNKGA